MVFNKMEIKGNNGSTDAGRDTCIARNTNTEVGSEFRINNLVVLYYVMCDFVCMFMWMCAYLWYGTTTPATYSRIFPYGFEM